MSVLTTIAAIALVVVLVAMIVAVVRAGRRGTGRIRRLNHVDPFALGEPWRFFVRDSLNARARYLALVEASEPGAVNDQLIDSLPHVDAGVEECWRVAQAGHRLELTRRSIRRPRPRMDEALADTEQRLEELNDRLEDLVAEAAQLSVRRDSDLAPLDRELTDVVERLTALREALDELEGPTPEVS